MLRKIQVSVYDTLVIEFEQVSVYNILVIEFEQVSVYDILVTEFETLPWLICWQQSAICIYHSFRQLQNGRMQHEMYGIIFCGSSGDTYRRNGKTSSQTKTMHQQKDSGVYRRTLHSSLLLLCQQIYIHARSPSSTQRNLPKSMLIRLRIGICIQEKIIVAKDLG